MSNINRIKMAENILRLKDKQAKKTQVRLLCKSLVALLKGGR